MEMFILDECCDIQNSDFQVGFVKGRRTTTAISLAHDVASYCISNGSLVFMCGLDAEGAFDSIPHPVIFQKTMGILSEQNWKYLYEWHNSVTVKVKWDSSLSEDIKVEKGTKQDGLTSPRVFNLFYKDLIYM